MSGQVIFIDDEAAIRQAVQQWLELSGFQVRTFSRAREALSVLDRDFPGVLISDVRMPDLDGLGLLERLIELDVDLPVIMVTGHGDVPMAVQALRQGAYDFIEKPFTPERLLDSVRRAMDKRRLVCENRQLREQFARKKRIESQLLSMSRAMDNLQRQVLDGQIPGLRRLEVGFDFSATENSSDVVLVAEFATRADLAAYQIHPAHKAVGTFVREVVSERRLVDCEAD